MQHRLPTFVTFASIVLTLCILLAPLASADRKMSEEAVLFRQLGPSVVTVMSDEGHGSGFLVDSAGVFLTNDHVVAHSTELTVQLDDSTRVAAVILAEDGPRDVAAVRVSPTVVRGRTVLVLASAEDLPFEGERIFAIGSPLHQSRILTTGIVSKREEKAIISDVNINPGNSGGPLLNLDGTVIAINTFRDIGEHGSGVSGSITISEAYDVLERARAQLTTAIVPSAESLPTMPKEVFPLDALKTAASAEDWNDRAYDITHSTVGGTGHFLVNLMTPVSIYRGVKQHELKLADRRRGREKKGGAAGADVYDPFQDLKVWAQYVGEYAPVVRISAVPTVGETGSSVAGNIAGAFLSGLVGSPYYRGHHNMEFKADLKAMTLSLNGMRQREIERFMYFKTLDFEAVTWAADYSGTDIARCGLLVFTPDMFAPVAGVWPNDLTLTLYRIDKPDEGDEYGIPRETMERVWLDFEPYREMKDAALRPLVAASQQ